MPEVARLKDMAFNHDVAQLSQTGEALPKRLDG